jgi:hypothetical protein
VEKEMRTFVTEKNGKVYHLTEWEKDECLYAIDSGEQGHMIQFVFLDYDENYPTNATEILDKNGFPRGVILETSPNRFALMIFCPTKVSKIFRIMWNNSKIDRGHAGCFLRFRQSSIRVSEKANSKGYPRIREVLENEDGDMFYDYNKERDLEETLEFFQEKRYKER